MAPRAAQPRNPAPSPEAIDKLIELVGNPVPVDAKKLTVKHTPPATFKPGEAIRLWMGPDTPGILHYRHLHQGERYLSLPTAKDDVGQVAIIPADFTNSPFPIQYYFEIRTQNAPVMYPGFQENFTGTPYFVVMPA